MKFCILNNWFPPDNYAGSGVYVYVLANALAAEGHEVTVVYDKDAFNFKSGGRTQANMPYHPNLRVIPLETGKPKLAPIMAHQLGRPLFKYDLLKEIFREDFDVIHFNNVSLMGAPDLYRFGEGVKVATLHDYWLLCPISTLFKYGQKICDKKSCFSCMLKNKKPPQLWRWSGLLKNRVEHISGFLSPSNFLKELHEKEGFAKPIFHLPNIIESPNGEVKQRSRDDDYFLFAGRIEYVKGVQEIIPSFKTGAFGKLLIAGDGSYRTELERLADGSPHIEFLGFLDQNTLRELYYNALATIVPSVWYDNQPTVILNSFYESTPIISRDLAGHGELTRVSQGGLLYEDQVSFESALKLMKQDAALRKRLGKAGFDYVNRTHTSEVHLKNYLAIIDQLRT